ARLVPSAALGELVGPRASASRRSRFARQRRPTEEENRVSCGRYSEIRFSLGLNMPYGTIIVEPVAENSCLEFHANRGSHLQIIASYGRRGLRIILIDHGDVDREIA